MSEPARSIKEMDRLDPKAAARLLVRSQSGTVWLDAFSEHLDRYRNADALERVLAVWGLNQSDAAHLFRVTRQAVSKWRDKGVPPDRAAAVANLAAATDLLVHYLKRDRIPAVVRRPIPALGNVSLLELVERGDSQTALHACRDMFAFGEAHG